MSNLKGTIESLASSFASNIISALRAASIDELSEFTGGGRARIAAAVSRPAPEPREPRESRASHAPPPAAKRAPAPAAKKSKSGRLGRRSEGDIARMIDQIVAAVTKSSGGLRAEQIRSALGVEAKELPRPLADAVNAGRLTKTGQKRATTYFAGGKKGKKR